MFSKTWVITVREYLAAVRTKSFIASLVLMPVMMFGSIVVQRLTKDIVDVTDKKIAVIDHTGGRLFATISEANDLRTRDDLMNPKTGKQKAAKFVFSRVDVPDKPDAETLKKLRFDLSKQIQADEIFAFIEIGKDIYLPRASSMSIAAVPAAVKASTQPSSFNPDAMLDAAANVLGDDNIVRYTTNRLTYSDAREFLQRVLNRNVYQQRLIEKGVALDQSELTLLLTPPMLANKGLVQKDNTGALKEQNKDGQFVAFIRPLALIFLMFIVVLVGVSPLTTNIIEEKNLRIAEVLLGSVRPFELMMGKLLGGVGVALTLGIVYIGGAWIGMKQAIEGFDPSQFLSLSVIIWFVIFTVLATLLFGSLFVAAGAAVSNVKEAQSLISPIMLIIVIPMFFISQLLNDPNGPIPMALTFFPFSAPMIATARMSIPPGVPTWQLLVACLSTLSATAFMIWAAGRIFRVGMLAQGSRASLGQMVKWVFSAA